MYYRTYNDRIYHDTNNIKILTTLESGQSFLIQWTYNINNSKKFFSWTIQGWSNNIISLFKSRFTLEYVTTSHNIHWFSIHEISEYQNLDHAEIVFIEDLILPNLNTNLIKTPLQHIDFQNKKQLLTNTTTWHWIYTTHNNIKQSFQIHIQRYCSSRYYLWWKDICSINGTINLTTPLVSGPISWKIQGSFWTSILQ